MAGSGNYYQRPMQREYGAYGGGGYGGGGYGMSSSMPYQNAMPYPNAMHYPNGMPHPNAMPYSNAMHNNYSMPAPMYQGAVPRITHQFPQSMFARERDGYLRDRAPCDDEDDEDIEAMTQQDTPRYSRSSRRDDDEDFEPVKSHQVRPRPNRSSHLEDEGEFETVRSATRPRYSAASLLDDDGDAEPVMKLEDIEEDLRKLRQATTTALNRFTTKSDAQPSTRHDKRDSSSSSYVRPSSFKPMDSSSYEPPLYDTKRSMYTSSRTTNKESDSENTTAGKRESASVPQDYGEQASQSRRRTPRTYEDDSKVNSRIAVMSRYILSKNKAKN